MHMTCRNCLFEFCWLCLGEYKKHYEATGRFLCNTEQDALDLGNFLSDLPLNEEAKVEVVDPRVNYYKTRYIEHQKSRKFAK